MIDTHLLVDISPVRWLISAYPVAGSGPLQVIYWVTGADLPLAALIAVGASQALRILATDG